MKKIIFTLFSFCMVGAVLAQNADNPRETARSFMRTGDWNNAILVLKKALDQSPGNVELSKDLALAYTYHRDFGKALETVKPLLQKKVANGEPIVRLK